MSAHIDDDLNELLLTLEKLERSADLIRHLQIQPAEKRKMLAKLEIMERSASYAITAAEEAAKHAEIAKTALMKLANIRSLLAGEVSRGN
jgi:hypothetical protein